MFVCLDAVICGQCSHALLTVASCLSRLLGLRVRLFLGGCVCAPVDSEDAIAISCLREWASASADDLRLAEALLGQDCTDPGVCLTDILTSAVARDAAGRHFLRRPVTQEVVAQLDAAIFAAAAPSAWVLSLSKEVRSPPPPGAISVSRCSRPQ